MADRNPSENRKNKILDRLAELVIAPFYRMNIARKLMLGYSVLLLLLVGISVLALYNLNLLNDLNSSIHETDLPVARISGEMIDVILAQEFYVQRYLILKSPDVFKDFWNKEKEFNDVIEGIQQKSFVALDSTVNTYRQFYWHPELFDRQFFSAWEGEGAKTNRQKAHKMIRELLSQHEYELKSELRSELDKIVAQAKAELL